MSLDTFDDCPVPTAWSEADIERFVNAAAGLDATAFEEALKREIKDTWGFTDSEIAEILREAKEQIRE